MKITKVMGDSFENDIKKHFEHRKIQPSADAWSKLEASVNQTSRKNKFIYFQKATIGIAAGLLLVIGLSLWQYLIPDKSVTEDFATSFEPAQNEIQMNPSQVNNTIAKASIPNHQPEQNTGRKNFAESRYEPNSNPTSVSGISTNEILAESRLHNNISTSTETSVISAGAEQVSPDKANIADAVMLLNYAEIAVSIQNNSKEKNKYDIDPDQLLKAVEKDASRTYLQKAFKSVKDISSPMFAAVLQRNEIKAE